MSQEIQSSATEQMTPYWDDDVVDHFITSEAHSKQKTPEQFRETHVDIDRIWADLLTPLGISGDHVTQENVLDAITASNLDNPNRIFIVRGEPGSGKSQLCEWIKYQVNGFSDSDDGIENYVALHVSRSQTRMDQIVQVLTGPLDVDVDVGNIEDLDPDDAASAIVEYMRGIWSTEHLTDSELQELTEKRGGQSDLREIFAKNIREYQEGLKSRDDNPDFNLLNTTEYRDVRMQTSFNDKLLEKKEILRPVLKNEAHEFLSRNLVGDFKEQLQEYSDMYQDRGVRPVLICEDLTTFSVLKEQLLDHIFELGSSNFDIVLGWTIGWEQDNIEDALAQEDAATYMKGRSEGYLTMTDEDGEAYFLDDDVSVALARSYLDAIKRNSEGPGASDEIEATFDNLYPFNERFIHVAYRQLNDEGSNRKTPRLLLLRVVKHCLKSTWAPYEAMKSNSFVDTPTFKIDMKYDQIFQDVSRWYGVPVEGGIGVKVGILETLGIELPDNDVAPVKGEYVVFDEGKGSAVIKKIKNPPTPKHDLEADEESEEDEASDAEDETSDDQDEGDGGVTVLEEPELTEEQRERERKYQEFQDWMTSGESYPSSDTLHDGAVSVLERWHEPTRLSNPNASTRSVGGIYYAGGDHVPVSIQGDQQRQASVDVELEWGSEHENLYTPMLYYALFDQFDTQTTNFDQLRAWADTHVAQFKREMRAEIEKCLRNGIESCLPEELSIEKTLVLAQFFLVNAARGAEITTTDGSNALTDDVIFEVYDSHREYGNPVLEHFNKDGAFGQAFNKMGMSSSDISDLIEGFFLLKSNVVDYQRLSSARKDVAENFEELVDAAMTIDTSSLADAYKVGTTRNNATTKLASLFDRISDYATELQRLTVEEDAAHIETALEPVARWYDSSHTIDELTEWFDLLYKCAGAMDVPLKPSHEEAYEVLTESPEKVHLSDFGEDIEMFQSMDDTVSVTLIARLHDFARSQHEQAAWDIYQAFDSLIGALQDHEHATGADLEHRITQLNEYSEYEQRRQTVASLTEDL